MELERDPMKSNGECDDDANSESDEDFEYVYGLNMYRVLAGAIHIQFAPKKLKGVARAQKGLLGHTREILRGKEPLEQLVVNSGYGASTLRLLDWRSLIATALYLSE